MPYAWRSEVASDDGVKVLFMDTLLWYPVYGVGYAYNKDILHCRSTCMCITVHVYMHALRIGAFPMQDIEIPLWVGEIVLPKQVCVFTYFYTLI